MYHRLFLLTVLVISLYSVADAWAPVLQRRDSVVTMMQKESSAEISRINNSSMHDMDRRHALFLSFPLVFGSMLQYPWSASAYSGPTIDVNNAMAREFTAFPGLYPTIATKIVNGAKGHPYKTKKDVYDVLDSDLERERLKTYDAAIVISKPDSALKQFKASQICKYECGSRVSSSFRDEQIKAVQSGRLGVDK